MTALINFERKNDHLQTGNRSKTGAETCRKSSKNLVWQATKVLLTVSKNLPPKSGPSALAIDFKPFKIRSKKVKFACKIHLQKVDPRPSQSISNRSKYGRKT